VRRLVPLVLPLAACARPATPVATAPAPSSPSVTIAAPVAPVRAVAPSRALQAVVDSIAESATFANAHWGVLVVDPRTGDTLATRNAGKLFMPASNQKLLTAALALATVDSARRWRTPIAATGPVTGGTLRGDLVVIGRGDPTWSALAGWPDAMAPLRALADSIAARGITRIAGRVRVDASAFPGAAIGYGWDWDDLAEPYGAGTGALLWHDGMTTVRVFACAGRTPCASSAPATTVPRVDAAFGVTGETQPRRALAWWRDSSATFTVRLAGTLGARDTVRIDLAQRDPVEAWRLAFEEALAARGIRVLGTGDARAPVRDTLFTWRSRLTMFEALAPMLKPSQNQWAESIWRTIALEATGVGSEDSARATSERWLASLGVPATHHAVRDGSGLSRHDYVTPALLMTVLADARRGPHWALLRRSLPVSGVDGTLEGRMRGTPLAGMVRAKTGTVDKARNLSGVLQLPDGDELLVVLLANNFSVPSREVDRAAETILLRAWRLAGGTGAGATR
jgi:D-alanyl-D-alanine carboxypeptidase/D-alanyl-D-alanine-endopeptidase (penicillin-binding protein 4)